MTISKNSLEARLAAVGGRLRGARLNANLSQKALAERTGVSLKTIANAEEHGRVSLDTFVRLLDGLGRVQEIDSVLAQAEASPVELLRRKGQIRQRARSTAREPGRSDNGDWRW